MSQVSAEHKTGQSRISELCRVVRLQVPHEVSLFYYHPHFTEEENQLRGVKLTSHGGEQGSQTPVLTARPTDRLLPQLSGCQKVIGMRIAWAPSLESPSSRSGWGMTLLLQVWGPHFDNQCSML